MVSIIFQLLHSLWKNTGNCSLYGKNYKKSYLGKEYFEEESNSSIMDESQLEDFSVVESQIHTSLNTSFFLVEIAIFLIWLLI